MEEEIDKSDLLQMTLDVSFLPLDFEEKSSYEYWGINELTLKKVQGLTLAKNLFFNADLSIERSLEFKIKLKWSYFNNELNIFLLLGHKYDNILIILIVLAIRFI